MCVGGPLSVPLASLTMYTTSVVLRQAAGMDHRACAIPEITPLAHWAICDSQANCNSQALYAIFKITLPTLWDFQGSLPIRAFVIPEAICAVSKLTLPAHFFFFWKVFCLFVCFGLFVCLLAF